MPNATVTPAVLVWNGGDVKTVPARIFIDPARLVWNAAGSGGGDIKAGPGTGSNDVVAVPDLEYLQRQVAYVMPDGSATVQFQVLWQRTIDAITAAFTALTKQTNDNTAMITAINTALTLAQAANDNAVATNSSINIANSYTNPVAVLTADNTGTITIAAHERIYGDGTTVAVNGGSLSGFAAGSYVSVYYDDASRSGGPVPYQGTTNAVAQTGNRHVVGQVTIPDPGSPPTEGGGVVAPGYRPPPNITGGGGNYYEP